MALGSVALLVLFVLSGSVLMIWALVDLLGRSELWVQSVGFNRIKWGLVILCIAFAGPVAYLIFERTQFDAATTSGAQISPPPISEMPLQRSVDIGTHIDL